MSVGLVFLYIIFIMYEHALLLIHLFHFLKRYAGSKDYNETSVLHYKEPFINNNNIINKRFCGDIQDFHYYFYLRNVNNYNNNKNLVSRHNADANSAAHASQQP